MSALLDRAAAFASEEDRYVVVVMTVAVAVAVAVAGAVHDHGVIKEVTVAFLHGLEALQEMANCVVWKTLMS